ncbi:alpha/beta fold hydrolase [Pseudonocardia zijingensis]|jgi:pimeloyl-ACP methyl ester carboxylesterase|uniref:AB hydrolase-1 domain-containing protein n=1 Tax=Pseudonocardia zijingensis TaxID=153376 RepID=A0ABN1N9I6_9PSEU
MERFVRHGEVALCVEGIGSPDDPALLLLGGNSCSMDVWDDELCARFAAGGRYVVRYDARDTGRSTQWPAGEPGYTGVDLVEDALRVLDGLGIGAAHLLGVSSGGAIAQRIAVEHPGRVRTLTLVATSIGGPADVAWEDLPSCTEALSAWFEKPAPDPDWRDPDAVVEYVLASERVFAGTLPADAERAAALVRRAVERTPDMAAAWKNHWIAEAGPPMTVPIGTITAPTLVLHGTHDPLFPYGHGEALAKEIPGARLVPLPGMGHQVPPPPVWDVLVAEVLRHTAER